MAGGAPGALRPPSESGEGVADGDTSGAGVSDGDGAGVGTAGAMGTGGGGGWGQYSVGTSCLSIVWARPGHHGAASSPEAGSMRTDTTSLLGIVKRLGGDPESEASMNALQIEAGKVPPSTLTPCTEVMGMRPSGYPTHTAATRLGV